MNCKKPIFRFLTGSMAMMAVVMTTGCSSDDNDSLLYTVTNGCISFDNVPKSLMASDEYGANLYSGSADQITTGYLAPIGESGAYAQFSINYAKSYDGTYWSYEFWNGGLAVSNFTNMTGDTFSNQCSVYDKNGGKSGSNFVIVNGHSDPMAQDEISKYNGCAKIYLTDKDGYRVVTPNTPVEGTAYYGTFNSVWVCNTTYDYLVMKNGNSFCQPLEPNNGWFKVIFMAMDKNNRPTGKKVEYYLANFDSSRNQEAGLKDEIRTGWSKVDLSSLGNDVCTVAIDFEGSDSGEWGLNTPAYVAIDDLEITVIH